MIISLSGRRVKRGHKNLVPARGRRTLCGGRPVWTRQAKALAPWAGVTYSLAEPLPAAPPAPAEVLHLTEDIAYLLQWWDACPTAAQEAAYRRERENACPDECLECGGDGWVYAPVGHANEQMGCPECGGEEYQREGDGHVD